MKINVKKKKVMRINVKNQEMIMITGQGIAEVMNSELQLIRREVV